jgi:hypothetical protein
MYISDICHQQSVNDFCQYFRIFAVLKFFHHHENGSTIFIFTYANQFNYLYNRIIYLVFVYLLFVPYNKYNTVYCCV